MRFDSIKFNFLLLIILLLAAIIFIDYPAAKFVNQTLNFHPYYGIFWAILNHPLEKIINVIIIVSITTFIIITSKHKLQNLKIILIAVLWLQIAIILSYYLIEKPLMRPSPSLIIPNMIQLSKFITQANFKIFAHSSLPSGHAITLSYWGLINFQLTRNKIFRVVIIMVVILFTCNRLFAGLHWISDLIVSFIIAYLWYLPISKMLNKKSNYY